MSESRKGLEADQVDAIINLAKAELLMKQPVGTLVSTVLPDLQLTGEDVAFIAALGKARDITGLTPEQMTFRVTLLTTEDGTRRVDLSFSNRNYGRTGSREADRLSLDIINAAKAGMSDNAGTPKEMGGYVGWQDYNTKAIASEDNGELLNFPIADATKTVEQVANQRQAAQNRREELARAAAVGG